MALLLILILIEFNPLILLNDHNISLNYVFIFEYSFFIFLNYIIYSSEKKTKLDLDLLFKYFLFFARKPSYFFNYVLNIFKKIYVYLAHFKYKSGYYLIKFT